MRDIQSKPDYRNIPLQEAGITDLSYPIVILDKQETRQNTVASITMSVNLPHHFKGTHMSRFIEVLTQVGCEFTGSSIPKVLALLKEKLFAESAKISIEFPYFLTRTAPVSGASAKLGYQCTFVGESKGNEDKFLLSVKVPVSTLCPCSKEISEYGAHNQRGYITIDVRTVRNADGSFVFVWIEDLIDIAESSASTPVFTILKRPDEKYVTEQAYNNPVFVEDIVRNVAEKLRNDKRITYFKVKAENHESIHNHNAYAVVSWSR